MALHLLPVCRIRPAEASAIRPSRVSSEGAFYHVYNHLGRGESVIRDVSEARMFTAVLREVARRGELAVLAWCLMGKSPDGVTKSIARASRRRAEKEDYHLALDHTVATKTREANNGGTA